MLVFCLWSLNTPFKGTWHVKVMEVTQTRPMANTRRRGTAGEGGFGAVADLDRANSDFTTIVF